jgi:tetratricopeptide (TPR) repeat protein
MSNEGTKKMPRPVARLGASAVMLVVFLCLIWMAGRAGYASFLTTRAAKGNLIASADVAVNLSPGDPEAHFVRGALLESNNELPAAIAEYGKAASLRPDDYVLWLSLARTSELNGDSAAALAAARQAVPLAPYYAQPHWQLGNLLVRMGQREEGFKELGLAGESNPSFMPAIIDLAWQLSHGDVQFMIRTLRLQRPESYQALAQYFRKKNEIDTAIAMYIAAGSVAEQDRKAYVAELISSKHFKQAYSLWSFGHPAISKEPIGIIVEPGFEQEVDLAGSGFGWRSANQATTLKFSLDPDNPKPGQSSFRVDFNGDSDPGTPIISQLVLVEPKTHYQLSFDVRTEDIVSGGPPNVFVSDAGDNKVLGQSSAVAATSAGWHELTIDFVSGESAGAVQITLQRDRCARSPCPIFGRLWLDSFSLQKV